MKKIYVFCDACVLEFFHEKGKGKKITGKSKKRKAVVVSGGAFQYNNPESNKVFKHSFCFNKSVIKSSSAEEKTILKALNYIDKFVTMPFNIIIHTDQKDLVDYLNKKNEKIYQKENENYESIIEEILKFEEIKKHKINLIWVPSTSKSSDFMKGRTAFNVLHNEMDELAYGTTQKQFKEQIKFFQKNIKNVKKSKKIKNY